MIKHQTNFKLGALLLQKGLGDYLFLIFRFIFFVCVSVLHIRIHGHQMHTWSLKRSEELQLWMQATM